MLVHVKLVALSKESCNGKKSAKMTSQLRRTDLAKEDIEELMDVGVIECGAFVEQRGGQVVGEKRLIQQQTQEVTINVLRIVHLRPQLGEQQHVQRDTCQSL